jgi:hypothetical protein
MSKTWIKSSLSTVTTDQAGNQRKRTFNNISAEATEKQLTTFGDILAVLTGLPTETTNLTTVSNITK